MKLIETIENRRSIRTYKSEEVSNELLKDLINCARLAPSAKNRQPWKFYILKGSKKEEITNIMLKGNKLSKESNSVSYTTKAMIEANTLILVYTNKENSISDTLSIGAAVQNILLRATDLELGSLWIRDTTYFEEEISNTLNIKDETLSCAISIGYKNQEPKQRPRKELLEIINFIS